jgi:hypothetical protein
MQGDPIPRKIMDGDNPCGTSVQAHKEEEEVGELCPWCVRARSRELSRQHVGELRPHSQAATSPGVELLDMGTSFPSADGRCSGQAARWACAMVEAWEMEALAAVVVF